MNGTKFKIEAKKFSFLCTFKNAVDIGHQQYHQLQISVI